MSKNQLAIGPAAKYLQVSIATLRRWDEAGKIKAIRTKGGTRLFPIEELDRIKQEQSSLLSVSSAAKYLDILPQTIRRLESANKLPSIKNKYGERFFKLADLEDFKKQGTNDNDFQSLASNPQQYLKNNTLDLASVVSKPTNNTELLLAAESTKRVLGLPQVILLTTLTGLVGFIMLINQTPGRIALPGFIKGSTLSSAPGTVLASSTVKTNLYINAITEFTGETTFIDPVTFQGNITAPNVVYGLTAGTGLSVTGTQNPTIGLSSSLVSTVNSASGALTIKGSGKASVSTSGSTITITSSATDGLSSEADTLSTVTGRGATTSTASTFSGGLTVGTSLTFSDSAGIVNLTDAGSLAFKDGTNTLATIVDQGAYGTVRLSNKGSTGDPATCTAGDLYFNATDAVFKGCSATNTWTSFAATTSLALSSITAATAVNSINSANFAQTWQWNSLATETAFTFGSTSASLSSGKLLNVDHTATYTSTVANSGNLLKINRALTTNTGGVLTTTGAVVAIADNCTQTAGTCTDSANVLSLTQSYASASGSVLNISNSGTGASIATGNITSTATGTNTQLSLGNITSVASATSYGINTGTISGAGTATYGINLGANSSTATTNYGINIGAISGAGTTNYGLYVGTVSGASTNYSAYFATGNSAGISIVSDLSSNGRTTDVLTISQANNDTYNNTANLIQLTNSDSGSTAALLNIDQTSALAAATAIRINSAGYGIIIGGLNSNGRAIDIDATNLTTSSAIVATGPTVTGVTDHFVKLTSDVGSAAALIYGAPDFSGAGVTAYGANITATDATTSANTDYGYYSSLALTGNAAKTGYGLYSTVTTSSTTADTTYPIYAASSLTGALAAGTRNGYGIYSAPASTAASTAGTLNLYGSYLAPTSTLSNGAVGNTATNNVYGEYITTTATVASDCTTNCTTNQYGLYVANGTSSINGTSTKYGIYVESPTGADTNYAAYFAGGNVNIQGLSASSAVYTDSLKNLTSTAPTSGAIGYWSRTAPTLSPTTTNDVVSISSNDATNPVLSLTASGASANGLLLTASGTTTGNAASITANAISSGSILSLSSTSTAATSNTQKGLNIALSGANGTSSQSTYAAYLSNTHTGTTATNYGLYTTATAPSGGTAYGLYANAAGTGTRYGIYANSNGGTGIYSNITSNSSYEFVGNTTGTGFGGAANSANAYIGYNDTASSSGKTLVGVYGQASSSIYGYLGWFDDYVTTVSYGVYGSNTSGIGVGATASTGTTLQAISTSTGSIIVATGDSITGGKGIDVSVDGLTTGIGINLQSTSASISSAKLISADHTATYTTTVANSGNLLNLTRALTTNTGGALTTTGAVAAFSSNCTQTAGTCTDSANILSLTQNYASASGAVLNISGSGTGSAIAATANAVTTGNVIDVTANGLTTGKAVSISSTSTAGGASGVSYLLNLARSGTNSNTAHTAYGIYSTVTNTNVTSGTNVAGYFSASGAQTANYGVLVPNGYVGIGNSAPLGELHVSTSSNTNFSRGIISEQNNTGAQAALVSNKKSRGSFSSPTTVASGDYIGANNFQPYVATSGYIITSSFGARVNGTVTGTAAPTEFFVSTASTNDVDPFGNSNVRLLINSTGLVGLGGNVNPQRTLDITPASSTNAILIGTDITTVYAPFLSNVTITADVGASNLLRQVVARTVVQAAQTGNIIGIAPILIFSGSGTFTQTQPVTTLLANEVTLNNTNATVSDNRGIWVLDPTKTLGTLTTNYGIYLAAQTAGSTNYGLCFDCDGTWTTSTVAAGIQFGTDANAVTLYRSASDTLKTDDSFVVGGTTFTASAATTATIGSTGTDTIILGNGGADTITIGNVASTGVSITDDNWSVTAAGVANFVSVGATTAGTGTFTDLTVTGNTLLGDATTDTITIAPATLALLKENAHTIQIADATTTNAGGGTLTIKGAAGNAAGAAGQIAITGGAGGAAAAGGTVTITGGAAGASSGGADGGATNLTGGQAGPTGIGGGITLTTGAGGSSSGASGAILLTSGTAATGANTGNIRLDPGVAIGGGTNGSILIGNTNGRTITIGSSSATTVSITDDNWSVTGAGVANFVSVGATTAGTGAFTTLTSNNTTTIGNGSGVVTSLGNAGGAAAINLTSGTGSQTFTSSVAAGTTTSSAFVFTANSLSSGTGMYLSSTATGFSGNLLQLSKTGASGSTSFTGDIANITYSQTFNATGTSNTGNVADLSRSVTVDDGTVGAISAIVSGAVLTISDNCTAGTADTCTNSANVLSLTQSYASASGAVLAISNSGTGASILLPQGTTTADGIQWGTDANLVTLYRSASDTLRTGDAFIAEGNITRYATSGSPAVYVGSTNGSSGEGFEISYEFTNSLTRLTSIARGTAYRNLVLEGNNFIVQTGSAAVTEVLRITGTGVGTYAFTGTTTDAFTITASSLTSGTALTLTGPSLTGVTGHFVKITSDVGSGAALIYGAPDFSGAGVTAYGANITATDATASGNTDYNFYSSLTGTGNAAKNLYGYYSTVTSNSTTAHDVFGGSFNASQTGAVAAGVQNVYGVYATATSSNATTSVTTNVYGLYSKPGGTLTTSGTINTYGLYVDNSAGNTTGTSSKYGIYIARQTGSSNNKAFHAAAYSQGTSMELIYDAAVTQNGNLTGMSIDQQTNFTPFLTSSSSIAGFNLLAPTYGTNTNATTLTYDGYNISSGGSVTLNNAAAALDWDGVHMTTPSTTCTSCSTSVATGVSVTLGSVTTSGTQNGFLVTPPSTTNIGSTYNGINIGVITTSNGTDTAIKIGSGWDNQIGGNQFTVSGVGVTTINLANQSSNGVCHTNTGTGTAEVLMDCTGTITDYAEAYGTPQDIEPGEVVATSTYNPIVTDRTQTAYQTNVIGVISTNPNDYIGRTIPADKNPQPIGLSGRIPVKVSTENGIIKAGDPLATSSIPGVAMKATQAGLMIGMALEDYDGAVRVSPDTISQEEHRLTDHPELPQYHSDPSKWPASVGKISMLARISWYFGINLASNGSITNSSKQQMANSSQQSAVSGQLLANNLLNPDGTLINSQLSDNLDQFDGQILTAKQIQQLVKEEVTRQLATSQLTASGSQQSAVSGQQLAINEATASAEATSSAQATSSAALADTTNQTLTDLNKLLATSNLKLDTLQVTGNSQLAATQVAGTFSQDGTLVIDYGKQINVLGSTLYLQNDGLAGNVYCHPEQSEGSRDSSSSTQNDKCGILVDIGAGKVTIDKDGNIVTKGQLSASALELEENKSAGSSKVPAGQASAFVSTALVNTTSKVIVTFKNDYRPASRYFVSEKQEGLGFTVALDLPTINDAQFDWIIVNTREISHANF